MRNVKESREGSRKKKVNGNTKEMKTENIFPQTFERFLDIDYPYYIFLIPPVH